MKPQQPGDPRRRRIVWAMALGIGLLLILGFVWRLLPTANAKVDLVFSHFETVNGIGDFAVFQVSNLGNLPVTFYGRQEPIYWIATAKGTNWGKETNWSFEYSPGFDHSKTQSIILPPGAKMTVHTVVPIPDCWMVGVEYSSSAFTTKLPNWVWRLGSQMDLFRHQLSIAWSYPITRSSKPTHVVAPPPTGPGQ